MKRVIIPIACTIALAIVVTAALAAVSKGPALGANTLVVGTRAEPKTLNPVAITASESQQIAALLFQKLLAEQDDFMSFKPQLARAWSFSADSLDVTFVLRDDARWSDGEPVTASDVRFTWQVETDTTVAWPSASIKAHIRDVEVKDSHTVVFHFDQRSLYQLMDANDGVILPEHLLASINAAIWDDAVRPCVPVGDGVHATRCTAVTDRTFKNPKCVNRPRIERVVTVRARRRDLVAQLEAARSTCSKRCRPRTAGIKVETRRCRS